MKALNKFELDCLRMIASELSGELLPCAYDVIQRLESLGLVERVPGVWLPLEMKRTGYRITAAGREVLHDH